jgi:hypothetical protein
VPTINVTGNSGKGSQPPYSAGDRALADYMNNAYDNRRRNTRQEADYQNRDLNAANKQKAELLKRINKGLATQAKETERYAKDAERWNNLYDRAQRADFVWEQQASKRKQTILNRINTRLQKDNDKWANLHDRAEREDFVREQQAARRKQQILNRFNNNLARSAARQQAQSDTAAYRAMRYDADQMNRLYDQQKGSRNFIGRAVGGFLSKRGGGGLLSRLGGAMAGEAGALELGPLGWGALAGYEAFRVARAIYNGPGMYSDKLDQLEGKATPYWDMRIAEAFAGRQGGFNGRDLESSVYGGGVKAPGWLNTLGLSPDEAINLVRNSGQPVRNADQFNAVGQTLASAQLSSYLGANDMGTLQNMLGLFTRVSGSLDNPNAEGNFSGNPGSTVTGQANDFFRRWGAVTQTAVKQGLDASTVANGINSLLQSQTAAGLVNITGAGTTDFYNRLMTSGLPQFRNASGAASAAQVLAGVSASAGYGGNSTATMAFQYEVNKRGGTPKSMSALGKMFGFDYSTLNPGQKREADDLLSAFRNGDIYSAASLAAPFINGSWQAQASQDWASSMYGNSYMSHLAFAGQMGGINPSNLNLGAGLATGQRSSPAGVLGWSDIDPAEQAAIQKYAKAAGVDPSILASLFNHESQFRPGAYNGSGGGFGAIGLGQIRAPALADLQKQGLDTGVTPAMLANPDINTQVSADYLGLLQKRYGSTQAALEHYYGSTDSDANNQYAQDIMSGASSFNGANSLSDINQTKAVGGQAKILPAKQASNEAVQLSSGSAADIMQGFDTAVGSATGDLNTLVSTVNNLNQAMANLVKALGSGGGPKPFNGPSFTPMHPSVP